MFILAIDPGPTESAYMVLDDGVPKSFNKTSNDAVLELISSADEAGRNYLLAIEEIKSYGKPVGQETFDTCVWVGRFYQASNIPDNHKRLIPRLVVKKHLCHAGDAKDPHVRQALIDRFGGSPAIKKGGALYGIHKDVWSALAVGIVAYDTIPF
jgi:hypothetical protein